MRQRELTPFPGALLLLVLVLPLALALHLVGMGEHGMEMLGACFAVLEAALLIGFVWTRTRPVLAVAAVGGTVVVPLPTPVPKGRYPPDDGTVLRD